MPYIGNTSPSRFVSNRAASVYSGDGSTTAFTLEQAVAQDEDVLVSVDGVIQEPSVAYAVSNGTTLTFTGAPSSNSGNNIFVYYLASQVGTVGHPSNQALTATTGTFSGAITGGGLLTTGGNVVIPDAGNIGSASDTDAIAISSGGVTTFSQTPSGTGWDLIYDATVSNAAQYDVDCTSTYDNYYIVFNLVPATDDAQLRFYQVVGGSEVTDNHLAYAQSQIDSASHGTLNASAHGNITVSNVGSDVGEDAGGWILLSNVNSTALPWKLFGGVNYATTDATHLAATFTGMQLPAQRANVLDKLRLEFSTGNVESGYVKVFGIK